MARRGRRGGGGRIGRGMFSIPTGNKLYLDLGLFTLIFVVYLWIAPKLIKKPAGHPPRSGSNEEQAHVNRTAAGGAPEPVGAKGTSPSPPNPAGVSVSSPSGVNAPTPMPGGGLRQTGTVGGFVSNPNLALGSSNVLGGPQPYNVGGQTSGYLNPIGSGTLAGAYRAGVGSRAFPSVNKISYQ